MVGSVFRRTPALVQRVILDHGASSVNVVLHVRMEAVALVIQRVTVEKDSMERAVNLEKVQHRRMNVTNVETGNECGYDKLLSMNSFLSTVYLTGALVIMSILLLLKATISCQILDAVFFLLYRI